MTGFYIGIRLQKEAKEFAKEAVYSVAKKFRVKGMTRRRVVPHVTLYGPGQTRDLRRVRKAVETIGREFTLVPFQFDGFGRFNNKDKVIYFKIRASDQLEDLREQLARKLIDFSTCQSWDQVSDYSFHSTIAFKDINYQFDEIWSHLSKITVPQFNEHLTRITVLAHGKIFCEYDLLLKRMLTRRQALSGHWRRLTLRKLRKLQGQEPQRRISFLDRLKRFFRLRRE
ncbi:2'-5' RNA ligase [Dehalogenimonas formicexedens]|uniref:2'-5' RNA ligase n=1 Tax=Dehalogenimonas formicexedens TaxID=1839801 RepID=A0A1P8F873_9CHLR|nr:2'-5' RNA ligase family protein [Dehalogenimonas formicexedens]APV44676.1 2'-5' RNA ligase [Dehalogenimonas formicexedens]